MGKGMGRGSAATTWATGPMAPPLSRLWLEHGRPEERWKEVAVGMDALRQAEYDRVVRLFNADVDRERLMEGSGLETCDDNYPSVFRFGCYVLWGLSRDPGDPSYPVRPKQGLLYQVYLWLSNFLFITWRRGIWVEAGIVLLLATTVAFTRSYNMTWNRRTLGGFFTSISLSLLGLLGALFNDDIGPVRRAADSGMMLGAYEFAMLGFTLFKALLVAHTYAVTYFTVLYLRRGVWCSSPFSWSLYFEFSHLLHECYMCACSVGALICVMCDHDMYRSSISALAAFIFVHTFAFFAPSKKQIKDDAFILGGRIDLAPLINFLCSLSYVRYYMEAFMLWEPEDGDAVGRNSALRFFGYHQKHKSMCHTSMFAIWGFCQTVRFILFARQNRNVFNSLHDTPLFLVFIAKLLLSFITSLGVMTIVHESPNIAKVFNNSLARYRRRTLLRRKQQADAEDIADDSDSDSSC